MKAIADMNQHTKDKKLDHVVQATLQLNKGAITSLAFTPSHSIGQKGSILGRYVTETKRF